MLESLISWIYKIIGEVVKVMLSYIQALMSKVFLVTVQIDFLLQSSLIYIAYYSINSFCVISLIFTRNLDSFNSY